MSGSDWCGLGVWPCDVQDVVPEDHAGTFAGLHSLLSEAPVERSAKPLNSWSRTSLGPSASLWCYPHCDELLDIESSGGTARMVDTWTPDTRQLSSVVQDQFSAGVIANQSKSARILFWLGHLQGELNPCLSRSGSPRGAQAFGPDRTLDSIMSIFSPRSSYLA